MVGRGSAVCEWCGAPLPPSLRHRRFCADRCRMAARRAATSGGQPPAVASPPPEPVDGPVTAAVVEALAEISFDAVDGARASLAVALARLVDGGSVPAAAQLRGVLDDLGEFRDVETLEFLASIRT